MNSKACEIKRPLRSNEEGAMPQARCSRPPPPQSLVVVCRRLDLVDPVPLPAGDLESHRRAHGLLKRIDCRKCGDRDAEDDDCGDVEEAILRLHQQLVVAPDLEALPRPEGHVHLSDAPLVLVRSVLDALDPLLATLLDHVELGDVVERIWIVIILRILVLGAGSVWEQVASWIAMPTERPLSGREAGTAERKEPA